MHFIVLWLLALNAFWDYVSATAMAVRYDPIARWHLGLWIDDSDRKNPAMRLCMLWFEVALGFARLAVVCDPEKYFVVGLLSYVLEAWFALMSVAEGLMKRNEGYTMAALSFACAGIMVLDLYVTISVHP